MFVVKRGLEPHSLPTVWATCVTSYIFLLTSYIIQWMALRFVYKGGRAALMPAPSLVLTISQRDYPL